LTKSENKNKTFSAPLPPKMGPPCTGIYCFSLNRHFCMCPSFQIWTHRISRWRSPSLLVR